jgi:hypothetical protein
MNVPLLNYAQMPVVQPPSEMAGFSNALLQAGAMRQDRLKAEQARADALQQTQFNQNIATQQLGLQQKADTRADQAQDMQMERHVADMATLQAQAVQREKQQALQQVLSTPEVQAQFKALEGDEIGQMNFLDSIVMETGNGTPDYLLETSGKRMQVLESKSRLATDELQRNLLKAKIASERAQQAQLSAAGTGGLDPQSAFKIYNNIQQDFTTLNSDIGKTQTALAGMDRILSSASTESDFEALAAALPPGSAQLKSVLDTAAILKGDATPDQKRIAVSQLRAKIEPLKQDYEIYLKEQQAVSQVLRSQMNQYSQLVGGPPVVPYPALGQPMGQQQQPGLMGPARELGPVDKAIDLFGQWSAKGNIARRRERRAETPTSKIHEVYKNTLTMPTSDVPRPSKATTTAAQAAPRYVDPAERTRKIQDISSKIQDIEKALPGLDMSSEIYGPMNRKIRENSERELTRLRMQLKEAEDTLPIQRTPVSSGRAFTGVY